MDRVMKMIDIRKSETVTAQLFLVFLGVALHSLLVFSPVLGFLNKTDANIVSLEFILIYFVVMIVYSTVTSLYVIPTMVISPYYIQIGTASVIIFITIHHVITNPIDVSSVFQPLLLLFLIFAGFVLGGFGLAKLLRWLLGMSIEPNNNWLRTYRIDAEYSLVKRIFDDMRFNTYKKETSENNTLTLTRKFHSGVKVLMLLKSDPNSPTDSILSISSCEVQFESIWKTDDAYKLLLSVRDQITGSLTHNYSCKLIEDKDEKVVSNECELLLLESFNTPLSKLGEIPRRAIVLIGGLLSIPFGITILSFIPSIQEKIQLEPNTIILTWITMISSILLLNSSGIKTTLQKIQKHSN